MNLTCVDDDADFLDLTAMFLERKLPSATVLTTTRVDDALDTLDTGPIHCVVSDYELPERTGLDFLRTVRGKYPELPFIFFTGEGSGRIASEAISAGVTDYLQKRGASQYDRLATRGRNAVAQYRAERELQERVEELTAISSRPSTRSNTNRSCATVRRS
ncbi:response regulator [Natronomonas salsuginis]|uniref:Response regulator n=1 Tax=Natronomonas salsuginis TaxID=2217661 RepID=A0A4U5J9D9_9EURY|nr:response regulator [Natronomonas salsuginis]TKR24841.1 response regulator [Natronomonas salsuginis]